jgi:hypothetical protein
MVGGVYGNAGLAVGVIHAGNLVGGQSVMGRGTSRMGNRAVRGNLLLHAYQSFLQSPLFGLDARNLLFQRIKRGFVPCGHGWRAKAQQQRAGGQHCAHTQAGFHAVRPRGVQGLKDAHALFIFWQVLRGNLF